MATAEELLGGAPSVDKTLVISNDLRKIMIPSSIHNLGVESDDEVLRLEFKMPRFIGDIDLSIFTIRINYLNAHGEGDVYFVSDVTAADDHITFSWLVGPAATRYKGQTTFNVCLKTFASDGTVDKEYNTTIAALPVLEGLEIDGEFIENTYPDLLEQWRRELQQCVIPDAVMFTQQNLSPEQQTQARENIGADFSYFGFKYSKAVATYDLSVDDSSVKMYLFSHDGGYAAVVAGKGAMKNQTVTINSIGRVTSDNREYAEHIHKINKVCIESGVTSVGDYFMHEAYYLKEVIFEDSSQIAYLGAYCFAYTQISGEFKFCKLENGITIDHSFYCCPNLQGITLGVSATEDRNFELSEKAFFGCLNLRHFKVDEPLNTTSVWGEASFEYCVNLVRIVFEAENVIPKGYNFILIEPTDIIHRYWHDVDKGIVRDMPIANLKRTGWKGYSEGFTEMLSLNELWAIVVNKKRPYYQAYLDCQALASEYDGKRHELATYYETDWQKKDEYLAFAKTTDLDCMGAFWGMFGSSVSRVPYYGSCWLFAYMHAWNTIHPLQQYDSIENFVAMLQETKITVDTELATALAGWDFKDNVMATGVYADGYFNEGNQIYATDLPVDMISSDSYTTVGAVGEASWGVRKVLGWTGERLTATTDRTWASIKKATIDSIFAGKPAIIECVRYSNGITGNECGGLHAVTAIGYDAKTDRFKIIDSSWGFPSDAATMEYWTTFEALLEPSEESAVWVFSAFDSNAILTPA